MTDTKQEPRPFCPNCENEFSISLWYSDFLGCCYRCQNCDEEFPLSDIAKLFQGDKL